MSARQPNLFKQSRQPAVSSDTHAQNYAPEQGSSRVRRPIAGRHWLPGSRGYAEQQRAMSERAGDNQLSPEPELNDEIGF